MPHDLRWSFEPVFPPQVFADPGAGALLARAGLYADHPDNLVPAFHSDETVAALLALDDALLRFLLAIPVSFAPHAATRGDDGSTRAASAIAQLHAMAASAAREGWDPATLTAKVDGLRRALRDVDLRHGTFGVKGDIVPDGARLLPYTRPGIAPLHVPSALRTLVGGEPAPLPQSGAATRPSFTATALAHGMPGAIAAAVRLADPNILTDALGVEEKGGTGLVFVRGGVRFTTTLHVGALPSTTLADAVERNILSPTTLQQTAHSARVVCTATALDGHALTADAVRTTLAIARAFEGAGVLLEGPNVFLPAGWVGAVLDGGGPGVWPLEAMVAVKRTPTPAGASLTLVGLDVLLGLGCSLHTRDPRAELVESTQRLMGAAARWLAGEPLPDDGAVITLEDGGKAVVARGDGWITLTPRDGGRPSWVRERVAAGRLALLNAAIDPITGWKPDWVRERIAAGRLKPLNDAVERAHKAAQD